MGREYRLDSTSSALLCSLAVKQYGRRKRCRPMRNMSVKNGAHCRGDVKWTSENVYHTCVACVDINDPSDRMTSVRVIIHQNENFVGEYLFKAFYSLLSKYILQIRGIRTIFLYYQPTTRGTRKQRCSVVDGVCIEVCRW